MINSKCGGGIRRDIHRGKKSTRWLVRLAAGVLFPLVASAQVQFTEVGSQVGVGAEDYDSTTNHALGVNWIDFDQDGWPDLFMVNGYDSSGAHLFRNEGDGTFSNQDALLPALPNVEMMGSIFADYDNDGDRDIYIFTDNQDGPEGPTSGPVNILLQNQWVENGRQIVPGQPLFIDKTALADVEDLLPVALADGPAFRSASGGWLDYDRDGHTDLYVCHWDRGRFGQDTNQDKLYRNKGDGTFEDATAASGLVLPDNNSNRSCLAFMAAHLDSDLWPDLYVVNIDAPSPMDNDFIFQNSGGTFVDRTGSSPGVGDDSQTGMGVTTADIDHNGFWDLYISDLLGNPEPIGNALYFHTGTDIVYADNTADVAGAIGEKSWGVNFLDVNSDGYDDLFVATMTATNPGILYINNQGDGTFTRHPQGMGLGQAGRGSAYADYDRDGDLDIAVANHNGNLELHRNDSANAGNWVQLQLIANKQGSAQWSNKDAIGTLVNITAGGKTYMRQVIGGDSGHGQNSMDLHFGLGSATSIEQIEVNWPSGAVQVFTDQPANTFIAVGESGANAAIVSPAPGSNFAQETTTFSWLPSTDAPVESWRLLVGDAPGSSSIFDSGTLESTQTSSDVSGLPIDGSGVYVRLQFVIDSDVHHIDYHYGILAPFQPEGVPAISSPAPGSVLPGQFATFQWDANNLAGEVTKWRFEIGTSPGRSDILLKGLSRDVMSYDVSGLPIDGSPVYVRLTWRIPGGSAYTDYVYTAANDAGPPGTPALISPSAGSVLPGSNASFSWSNNGAAVTKWGVEIGSATGASDYLATEVAGGVLSLVASGLPTDSSEVHVRLTWWIDEVPTFVDYVYTAASSDGGPLPNAPLITAPVDGTVLTGSTQTFSWIDNGTENISKWRLEIGTSPGAKNLLLRGLTPDTLSFQATGLPTDGSPVYVRLSWRISGQYNFADFVYTASTGGGEGEPPPTGGPEIVWPLEGSVMDSSKQVFEWDDNGLEGINKWRLEVGTSPGARDIVRAALDDEVTSYEVEGLPTDGSPVYVRLAWRISGTFYTKDFVYSATSRPDPVHSVARLWNDVLLESIRKDFARPTVHARNLWHISAAMYDIWSAYEDVAGSYLADNQVGVFSCPVDDFPAPEDVKAAREEAISFAAYRLLNHRFATSPAYPVMSAEAAELMADRGYDSSNTSVDYTTGTPAALGNYIAECYISFGLQDGANEQNDYDNLYYSPVNLEIKPFDPGNPNIVDLDRWQPISLPISIDQSGNVIYGEPVFLSPEWGNVVPFSLTDADKTPYVRGDDTFEVYMDPGAPPTYTSEDYKWGFSMVSIWSSHLDQNDGVMIDISPASLGNAESYPNVFSEYENYFDYFEGGDSSRGYAVNPTTGLPYEPQLVPRGDYARVLAEFWADGPDSETPPGHWFVILNTVADHPDFVKTFGGTGPELDPLEWDVKAYFTMGGAMHDSAVAAWSIKGWYDYLRPVSALRAMADRGQSSNSGEDYYDPDGMPLVEGYIELVQPGDALAGDADEHVGKIKILAWRGPEHITDPATDQAGVGWILAENWWPYQRPSFVTPPFAGYVSGHSTFSRAAAKVMTALSGSEYFPGGMSSFRIRANRFLVFEQGPSVDMTLQWATYQDASDQTSLSRIWGGIHPPADDMPGRAIGEEIGVRAFSVAEEYFNGQR